MNTEQKKRQKVMVRYFMSLVGGGAVVGTCIAQMLTHIKTFHWTGAALGAVLGCFLAINSIKKWKK